MSVLAAVILCLAFLIGGLLIGFALGRASRVASASSPPPPPPPPSNIWVKPTEPPDPGSRPEGSPVGFARALDRPMFPEPPMDPELKEGRKRIPSAPGGVYGVTEVPGMQCINPRCRTEHPEPNVVIVGIGLSGSAYFCRNCTETW